MMLARSALVAGLLATGWSLAVLASGGFDLRAIGVPVVARTPWPTTAAAAALLLAAFAMRHAALLSDLERIASFVRRHVVWFAFALSLASGAIAMRFGTEAVGGSDSNCYVEQAERWAAGTLLEPVRPGFVADWPNAALSLTPTGFVPSHRVEGAIAPICPSGLSLAMSLPRVLGAPRASVFAVVPLFAAVAVFCVFALGRRLTGPVGGVCAALLTASSPILLYQAVQPMSDIPATALWVLALACAARGTSAAAFAAGLAAGAAVLVRPNLAPLAGLVVTGAALGALRGASPADALPKRAGAQAGNASRRSTIGDRDFGVEREPQAASQACRDAPPAPQWLPPRLVEPGSLRRSALAILGLLPGLAGVGIVQHVLYGSALSSGYGSAALLFRAEHVSANLARYPRWLLETHSPVVLLGLVAPVVVWRLARQDYASRCTGAVSWAVVLWAFSLAAFAAYLPYVPFDGWWFVRFWLPGILPLLVLAVGTTDGVARLLVRWSTRDGDSRDVRADRPWASPARVGGALTMALVLGCTTLAAWQLGVARDRSAFQLRRFERKFVTSGEYVGTLPANAVVLTIWHSGAVWYYGHRPAIMWDAIAPDGLDAVVGSLRRQGREVYLLLEPSEEDAFRMRFAGATPFAQLDWPPRARIGSEVTLWALDDRDRFLRGEGVRSERVWGR